MRTVAEEKKKFFWHDKTKFVKKFIRIYEKCQLAKQSRDMRFGIEEMKSIPIYKLFYHVVMDIVGPLP
jgi:hypothetical protein